MKVFLGGTCNGSKWREKLIPLLKIDYFNPVVPDWTEECYQEELMQRKSCDFCLYTITPLMAGAYSIAEVIDDSNKRPSKTIFCLLDQDKILFTDGQLKSLDKVGVMVEKNGGKYFKNLSAVADFINSSTSKKN